MEPDKCEIWEWVKWPDIRSWAEPQMHASEMSSRIEERKLFLPLLSLLQQRPGMDPTSGF